MVLDTFSYKYIGIDNTKLNFHIQLESHLDSISFPIFNFY